MSSAPPTFAFRLAQRELRGGMHGLGVFLGCLVLGVTAIAAIGSVAASVTTAIKEDARDLLGGDAEVRLAYRSANSSEREFLTQSGSLAEVATMRAMARTEDGTRRSLIELKAVDAAYPLYGEVELSPPQRLDTALSRRG
ncbi:MAG: ABC transporter permease, partial [Alphaproteobacteria bacterium]|nr:ABC transporter permease [Alphaproteobacteria bacterium]